MNMALRTAAMVCAAALLGGCAINHAKRPLERRGETPTGFLTESLSVEGEDRLYCVYVPADYDPAKRWPLVVFLHGMGERGRDGLLQTEVGIGTAIRRWSKRFPCIVLMPQCPPTCWWDGAANIIDGTLSRTRNEYTIDPRRVYLTGLSMGGYGAWKYGAAHAAEFAAILPICGGGDVGDAPRLATVPIWAFHGADDTTVNPEKSREMVEAVKAAGGDVRYTEYPGVDHNSWDKTYGDPKVIQWMLRQTKRK